MIKKVRIKNFKCYGPQGADFNLAKINFIFGDNSAGKSTFLQFLKKVDEVCSLYGKYERKALDKFRFRGLPGDILAKLRVEREDDPSSSESIWDFRVSTDNENEYELVDASGNRIGSEELGAVLPVNGVEHVVHIVANRKNESSQPHERSSFENAFAMRADKKAVDYLNDIFSRLEIHCSCVKKEDGQISSTMIHDNDFGVDLPLSEVGTGIDGLVHLALTLNAWHGGILALEEPETNVNEMQMEALTRVLVDEALKRESGQLIVECHSKLMALLLIELVRKGKLKCANFGENPDGDADANLNVMVIEKSSEGSKVKNVTIRRNGDVNWPSGFFPAEGILFQNSYKDLYDYTVSH